MLMEYNRNIDENSCELMFIEIISSRIDGVLYTKRERRKKRRLTDEEINNANLQCKTIQRIKQKIVRKIGKEKENH
jgi:hypothetical protein